MSRYFGRVTLFGEYLMHDDVAGYVFPAPYWVACGTSTAPAHPSYDAAKDEVAERLRTAGLTACGSIAGDLPFGAGFASSTALALAHLGDRCDVDVRSVTESVDEQIHGFKPSGVDFEAVSRFRAGFYGGRRWDDAPPMSLPCLYAVVPVERERPLSLVRSSVLGKAWGLTQLAQSMRRELQTAGAVRLSTLNEYATELLDAGVYSERQRRVVAEMLGRGWSTKAIGGLYDKALVVVLPDGSCVDASRAAFSEAVMAVGGEILGRGR